MGLLRRLVGKPLRAVQWRMNLRDLVILDTEQRYDRHNERPYEYAFVFSHVGKQMPKRILDVGTGGSALPSLLRTCGCLVTAIDNVTDYWTEGLRNRHWLVHDDDVRRPTTRGSYDMVVCVSTLEHIDRFDDAVRGMASLLARGGWLVLTCPYTEDEFIENVYGADGAREEFRSVPYICRSF